MTEPTIFPTPGSPQPPEPPKRDYVRATYILTVVTVVVTLAAAAIAVVAWVYPFQAVVPSPLQTPTTPPVDGTLTDPGEEEASTSSPEEVPSTASPLEAPGPGPEVVSGVQDTGLPDSGDETEGETIAGPEAHPAPSEEPSSESAGRPSSWIERLFGRPTSDEEPDPSVEENDPPPPPPPPGPSPAGGQTSDGKPVASIGDQVDAVFEYRDPQGPKLLGEIALPKLPAEGFRSLADGKRLVVKVWVTTDGKGRVTSMQGDWMPAALQQRIREQLERRPWRPSNDSHGVLRNSEAELVFTWTKP